jgi:cob(I)alamin adenosyltransferase
MKTSRPASRFTAIVLCACSLFLASATNADDKATGKDRIKELQKQRLEAAKKANDIMVSNFKEGFLPVGADATTFVLRLGEVKKLLLQARLDLAETKAERIKAIEETIKEIEPLVDAYEKRAKAGVGGGGVDAQLAQVYLLEMKIALEKTKQE